MEQLTLTEVLPAGYLPCSNPDLVRGYISIEDLLKGNSGDFGKCYECGFALCEHALNEKRADHSYRELVEHFRKGGLINQPVAYDQRNKQLANGHHRLAAAYDAGYTHIPYCRDGYGDSEGWWDSDWTETYAFTPVTD